MCLYKVQYVLMCILKCLFLVTDIVGACKISGTNDDGNLGLQYQQVDSENVGAQERPVDTGIVGEQVQQVDKRNVAAQERQVDRRNVGAQ